MKSWIRTHPIYSYFIFTILWSFSFWSFLFLYIEPGQLLKNPPAISMLFVVLGGLGPSLSGLIATGIIYGRAGLGKLIKRTLNWRIGYSWLSVLIIPAATSAMPLLRSLNGTPIDWTVITSKIYIGLGIGITAGIMEEFGWRGFLLPHMLKKYSPLQSSILIGLIFWGGIWHGYADFFGIEIGSYTFALILLLGPCMLTAWSMVLTWVYKRTNGSLLASILVHASISSSAFIFGQQYANQQIELFWTLISVGIAILVASTIWIVDSKAIAKPIE